MKYAIIFATIILTSCAGDKAEVSPPPKPPAEVKKDPPAIAIAEATEAEIAAKRYRDLSLTASRGDIIYSLQLSQELQNQVKRLKKHKTKENVAAVHTTAKVLKNTVAPSLPPLK